MRSLLLDYLDGVEREVVVKSWRPRYNRTEQKLISTIITKKYRNEPSNKRMIFRESCGRYVSTVPFGAKHTNYADTVVQ